VTPPRRRIALVSSAGETRAQLAGYLTGAGFEVHECDELAIPSSFGALVVISGHEARRAALVASVGSWIRLTKIPRVVVVTSKPMAWNDLLAMHGERLIVLPAPVFGWDLVDALRAGAPTRPRGA
jgi:hypothetical protein